MSIYAVINPYSNLEAGMSANMISVEDVTVWNGISTGVFRAESHKSSDCGTLIEMIADDEAEARRHLDSLPFVRSGHVDIALRGVSGNATPSRIDCGQLIPLPTIEEQLPRAMQMAA